ADSIAPQSPWHPEPRALQQRRPDILRFQLDRLPDDLTATIRIVRRRDEHVPPDGGHLWPVLLAQDVGQAFPAETWPDHVEVAFGVDVELDAIRGEPGRQDRTEASAEVPTALRGAEEHDLRLVPPDELRHHLAVRT